MESASSYMVLAAVLFLVGVIGVLIRREIIVILMSIEIMLNAVNLQFLVFARLFEDVRGQMFVFMVMVVAAAEAVLGLAFVLLLYRNKKSANVDDVNLMRW